MCCPASHSVKSLTLLNAHASHDCDRLYIQLHASGKSKPLQKRTNQLFEIVLYFRITKLQVSNILAILQSPPPPPFFLFFPHRIISWLLLHIGTSACDIVSSPVECQTCDKLVISTEIPKHVLHLAHRTGPLDIRQLSATFCTGSKKKNATCI